jgi:DNA-binding transcriptional LysR family regulator
MRFEGLDLNLLVALDALLETQNVTETARRLNLSQPSVSAALGRLREYFNDPLLTQIGRKMMPTAKGQELAPAIKEMLNLVRFRIAHADDYDAFHSQRRFNVIASDYAFDIVVSKAIARAERLAPHVTFDVTPPGPAAIRHFENGDVDVLINVSNYLLDQHPQLPLFNDKENVICWDRGRYAAGITAEEFLEASHAVAVFGEERRSTVFDLHLAATGIRRRIAVQVGGFSSLPSAVVGTDRVAVMHRRHANHFSTLYPIRHHAVPIPGPGVNEVVQWHRLREKDAGVLWLISLLQEETARLSA